MAGDKGLLAADESPSTCDKRFAAVGIPQTVALRRAYRALLVRTPGLADSISGVILCDETLRESTPEGVPFATAIAALGMMPGIKVDAGAKRLAGHTDGSMGSAIAFSRTRGWARASRSGAPFLA